MKKKLKYIIYLIYIIFNTLHYIQYFTLYSVLYIIFSTLYSVLYILIMFSPKYQPGFTFSETHPIREDEEYQELFKKASDDYTKRLKLIYSNQDELFVDLETLYESDHMLEKKDRYISSTKEDLEKSLPSYYRYTYFEVLDTRTDTFKELFPDLEDPLIPELFMEQVKMGNIPGIEYAAKLIKEAIDSKLGLSTNRENKSYLNEIKGLKQTLNKSPVNDEKVLVWKHPYYSEDFKYMNMFDRGNVQTVAGWTKKQLIEAIHNNNYSTHTIVKKTGEEVDVPFSYLSYRQSDWMPKLYYQALYYLSILHNVATVKSAVE